MLYSIGLNASAAGMLPLLVLTVVISIFVVLFD